jgi:hypothetical protein
VYSDDAYDDNDDDDEEDDDDGNDDNDDNGCADDGSMSMNTIMPATSISFVCNSVRYITRRGIQPLPPASTAAAPSSSSS